MNNHKKIAQYTYELLLFILVFSTLLSKIFDLDIWYHLSIGREIFTTQAIPELEFLVYTNAEKPVTLNEWCFGVLLYMAHLLGGLAALSVLNALILTGTLWFLYKAAGVSGSQLAARVFVLLALLAWGIHYSRYFRPEIVLYAALAVEVFLLERFLAEPHWRWLIPIPIISFILAQAHPSVVFLVFVLGCYGLQSLWWNRDNRHALATTGGWLLACGIAAVMTAAINPYGLTQLVEPFLFAAEAKVHSQVAEFIPSLGSPQRWAFLAIAGCALVSLAFDKSRLILNACLVAAFGILALRYQRNITLLALIAYVPVSHALSRCFDFVFSRAGSKPASERGLKLQRLLLGLAGVSLVTLSIHEMGLSRWGIGIVNSSFPIKSATVINEVKPAGRLFNHYDFGGYLGWELQGDYQVFIDGRNNRMRRSLAMHNSIMQANAGWETALLRYDVNTIVVPTVTLVTGTLYSLVERLLDHDKWVLAAVGDRELLFFREDNLTEIQRDRSLDKAMGWQQLLFDAQKHIVQHPNQTAALYAAGIAALRLGYREEARRSLEIYLQANDNDQRAFRALQQLEAQE